MGKKTGRDDSCLLLDVKNVGKINKWPVKGPTLQSFYCSGIALAPPFAVGICKVRDVVKRAEDGPCREAPEGKLKRLVPSSFLCLPPKCVCKKDRVRRDTGAAEGQAGVGWSDVAENFLACVG